MAVNVREFKTVPTALALRSPAPDAMWPLGMSETNRIK